MSLLFLFISGGSAFAGLPALSPASEGYHVRLPSPLTTSRVQLSDRTAFNRLFDFPPCNAFLSALRSAYPTGLLEVVLESHSLVVRWNGHELPVADDILPRYTDEGRGDRPFTAYFSTRSGRLRLEIYSFTVRRYVTLSELTEADGGKAWTPVLRGFED